MPPAPIRISRCFWEDYLDTQTAQLPHLPDVERLSDRVVRIMGGNPGPMQLQGTNTYLIGTGRSKILIDTGEGKPLWIQNLTSLLQEKGYSISHVLLTHWHGDHVGGVPDLVAYDGTFASRIYKCQPDPGQGGIVDDQVFSTEGATLRAVHTPGHAFDHMCFILEEEHALFTGDNILGHGNSVSEDLGTYMKSLRKMQDLQCSVGYPAHGQRIADLVGKLRNSILAKSHHEEQVYAALTNDANPAAPPSGRRRSWTTEELVQKMYGSVPEEACELAIVPWINEMLRKLLEDQKVCFETIGGGRRWFASQQPTVSVCA